MTLFTPIMAGRRIFSIWPIGVLTCLGESFWHDSVNCSEARKLNLPNALEPLESFSFPIRKIKLLKVEILPTPTVGGCPAWASKWDPFTTEKATLSLHFIHQLVYSHKEGFIKTFLQIYSISKFN